MMTRPRFDFYGPAPSLSKLGWTVSLEVFDTSPSAYVSHYKATVKLSARQARPWTLKQLIFAPQKKKRKKKKSFQPKRVGEKGRQSVEERDRDSERVSACQT